MSAQNTPAAEMIGALRQTSTAIRAIRKALGAPGDHGYGTPTGDALFELYKALGVVDAVLAKAAGEGAAE